MGNVRISQADMVENNTSPGRGPRGVYHFEIGGPYQRQGGVVRRGEGVLGDNGAAGHVDEDGVAGGGGDGPLTELHIAGKLGPRLVVEAVVLDADDEADAGPEMVRSPPGNGLQRHRVGVGVNAPFFGEDEIPQEARFHAGVLDGVVCLPHMRARPARTLHRDSWPAMMPCLTARPG